MTNNKYALASIALLSLTLLNGCGGGGATSNTSVTDNTPSQPHQLYASNVQTVDVLSRPPLPAPTVTADEKTITITYYGASLALGEHNQFYLNIDNDTTTGYQFDGEAWDKAGADYIVEDGKLFKSTANDSSWSWDTNVGDVTYTETATSVSVTIDQSLLQGLAPTIRVGLMKVENDWNKLLDFYPHSSLMAEYSIDIPPPVDTIPPVVTLIGAQTINVKVNSVFTDPGATAKDNIDGDITHKITTNSNLDTSKLGVYKIIYKVSDSAGLSSTKERTVKVISNTPQGIVVDGKMEDWVDIPYLAADDFIGYLRASDDADKLYLLIDTDILGPDEINIGENTQIFIDTDNDSATGFQFNGSVWNQGGADYMIENNHLDKSTADSSTWSWNYNVAAIEFIKKGNLIEIAIPKSALGNLADTINIGFVNRDEDWNVLSVLPEAGMVSFNIAVQPQGDLVLLPKFCGQDAFWETRGTPDTTQVSSLSSRLTNKNLLIEHNGDWYGTWERLDASTGETRIDIVKYDGEHTFQFLPLDIIRGEPLGNDKITAMVFLSDTLYFVFGNELWSTVDGGFASTHLVKKFENAAIREIHPAGDFLALKIHTNNSDSDIFQTWIVTPSSDATSETIFNARPEGALNMLFSHPQEKTAYMQWTNTYYKYSTSQGLEIVDFIPLVTSDNKVFYKKTNSSQTDLWVNNGRSDTLLIENVNQNIRFASKKGALYFRENVETGTGTDRNYYRLDEENKKLIFVVKSHTSRTQRPFSGVTGLYFVNNEDYYRTSFSFRRRSSSSLYKVIANGENEKILYGSYSSDAGGPNKNPVIRYINDTIYWSAYNSSPQHIGTLNNNTGEIIELSSCQ